ncbi:MAG: glycosyltransferase family 4 protein [Alphaproteobacteria bacterium]|nr:glycosyltransferase family 4 protein [Alphaproteobacteria bacterium]
MATRLAFLITEDWYFRQHFLALAIAARDVGYDIHVLCRTGERGSGAAESIRMAGLSLHEIPFARSGLNPIKDLSTRRRIAEAFRTLNPDIVHNIALKPIIYGQAAARSVGIPARVNFLPGFGHVFTSDSLKTRLLRPLISFALSRALAGENIGLMVMNQDDRAEIAALAGVVASRVTVLPGTGVDLNRFEKTPEPDSPLVVTYVGRFLRDKGLRELVEAGRLLDRRGANVKIRLVGAPDPSNPASIGASEQAAWEKETFIEILPWTDDVASVWRRSHLAVLPSYREGFGMSLVEAAASGRALIATDVQGCREAVLDRRSGILVPPRDPVSLAGAIETLAFDPALRRRFAASARRDAEERLSSECINQQVLHLYDGVLRSGRAYR